MGSRPMESKTRDVYHCRNLLGTKEETTNFASIPYANGNISGQLAETPRARTVHSEILLLYRDLIKSGSITYVTVCSIFCSIWVESRSSGCGMLQASSSEPYASDFTAVLGPDFLAAYRRLELHSLYQPPSKGVLRYELN